MSSATSFFSLRGNQAGQIAGQATVELIGSAGLLIVLFVGSTSVFRAEWERDKCAYFVFEKAHAALTESRSPNDGPFLAQPIALIESGDSVKAAGICQGASEVVILPRLEPGIGRDL